ncbi:MAG: DNA polymerase III subunit epsilon [Hahellaceae bacterium]|nr:DNA polymerase III subunit epsilon [Hahellaceae bacterium]
MRQVVLDTETTGINISDGNRIIEIGCVEVVDRKLTGNHFHCYINPQRLVEEGALAVHGLTDEFLSDKPLFKEVATPFLEFVKGAELVIHNAAFDIGFINHEFALLGESWGTVADYCSVLDTLAMARKKHPGQKNNLDALCKRYGVDNSGRDFHGALLDAEILADVYLAMTGGQTALSLEGESEGDGPQTSEIIRLVPSKFNLRVIRANNDELAAHQERLKAIEKSAGKVLWLQTPQ